MNQNMINNENKQLSQAKGSFPQVRLPRFKFIQDRWSTIRTKNAEHIAEIWQKDPTLVKIFQDPQFGHMQMALLRKDQLEALIKVVRDSENRQEKRAVKPSPLSTEEHLPLED